MLKQIYHIILLGPQGSGKGTQAKLLAEEFNLEHLEIGAALRKTARTKTTLGKKVASIIDKGKMVPFDMIIKIVRNRVKNTPKKKGIVFDGTPRRMSEVDPLENILNRHSRSLTHVFFLWISERETLKRLSKRKSCEACGTPFIVGKTISVRARKCPKCKGNMTQRKDETPEAIKQRLRIYHKRTRPVIEYYRQKKR